MAADVAGAAGDQYAFICVQVIVHIRVNPARYGIISGREVLVVTKPADATPYAGLSPETVLAVAEAAGLMPDGRLFALNSYENRVFRVGCDDGPAVVLKFYRAGRWTDEQILEEHEFAAELVAADLPVVAPLNILKSTLFRHGAWRVAAFPLALGGAPDLDTPGALELLGRTLARWHALGARRPFRFRVALRGALLGSRGRLSVLGSSCLPAHCAARYSAISARLIETVESLWRRIGEIHFVRVHGDCHLGNILWHERGPLFVDLDDCVSAPAIQDLWMFLSGSSDEQQRQWSLLMSGYEQFADFDYVQLQLVEALRATRMINHAGWIASRWADPAFPRAFPDFAETAWWERHTNDLAEQIELVDSPPLLATSG
jgi:Ser/Thr protein kinase RdoA (MazF antagonist)